MNVHDAPAVRGSLQYHRLGAGDRARAGFVRLGEALLARHPREIADRIARAPQNRLPRRAQERHVLAEMLGGVVVARTLRTAGFEDQDAGIEPTFGGRAIARAIDGARLVLFDGMGHDLPQQLWDRVIGVLAGNFAEAG